MYQDKNKKQGGFKRRKKEVQLCLDTGKNG